MFGSLLGLEPFSLLISYFIWASFKSSANLHLLAEKGRERERFVGRQTELSSLYLGIELTKPEVKVTIKLPA